MTLGLSSNQASANLLPYYLDNGSFLRGLRIDGRLAFVEIRIKGKGILCGLQCTQRPPVLLSELFSEALSATELSWLLESELEDEPPPQAAKETSKDTASSVARIFFMI